MKKIGTLLLFVTLSTFTYAQTSTYREDVLKCIKSNGTINYYEDVIDQMYQMLEKQFDSENVSEAVWEEVKSGKTGAMAKLGQLIVSAYEGHFTHKDVKNMNALYATQAGMNMFKIDAITVEDKVVLDKFYKSETGQKIINSQKSMNASMSKISELWSSELYQGAISFLSEKGYNL